METEYVTVTEASKETVRFRKFFGHLEVIPSADKANTLYYDSSAAIANTKESRHYKRTKQIDQRYYIIREYVIEGVVDLYKIVSKDNLVYPFTKTLVASSFERHVEDMGMRDMAHLIPASGRLLGMP